MPVSVSGLTELRSAMRRFSPESSKGVNKALRGAMKGFVRRSKGFVPSDAPQGLSRWGRPPKYTALNKGEYRAFPSFQTQIIRLGIGSKVTPSKPNRSGWRSLARVENRSAAGAIYETAGRKHPNGNPRSRSKNPNAGAWFISHLPALSKADNPKFRGRLIFRAYQEDGGKTTAAVIQAIQNATKIFNINSGSKKVI